jgi:hypothetical protein
MSTKTSGHKKFLGWLTVPGLALIAAGCATTPTVRAQAPPATATAPQAPPPPARAEAAKPEPAKEIDPASYDASKDPLSNAPDTPDAVSVIRARVNNVSILDEDLRAACFQQLHAPDLMQLPEDERKDILREILSHALQDIIDRELMLSELHSHFGKQRPQYVTHLQGAAKKEFEKHLKTMRGNLEKNGYPLKSDPGLKKFFAIQGTTFESYKRHFERNFIMMEFLRALIYPDLKSKVGHREIVEYYERHGSEFETTDNVVWQDLFIDASRFRSREDARRQADNLRARALKEEDFAKLVKEFDQGDSSWRQGEGVGHRPGEIRPAELEPTLFKLKAPEVGPVVEVTNGFHVVKVTKREYTGLKPLNEDLQTEIRRKLMNEMASREQRRILVELRRKAFIEVIQANGSR